MLNTPIEGYFAIQNVEENRFEDDNNIEKKEPALS